MGERRGPRFTNIVEDAVEAAGEIAEDYARTIRSDSSAILEALVADLDPATLDAALTKQGFALSTSYHTTLRYLACVARDRRVKRHAGMHK
jgi:hypothetical protein